MAGRKPRLLDLFCGAGGASVGYERAGFTVVGIDIEPQPHYPFSFVQADAMEVLATLAGSDASYRAHGPFDVVHASPPCQDHSSLSAVTGKDHGTGWMLEATVERLKEWGGVWVVENVVGAPLSKQPDIFGTFGVELCGTMFGLKVLRHRLFQSSVPLVAPPHGSHIGEFYSPAGHGDPNWSNRENKPHLTGPGYADRCREAMGVDWMNRDELAQAIPPAYTDWIGRQLMGALVPARGIAG